MNPYEVLGVPPDADEDAIRAAYRRERSKHHPDRDGGDHEQMSLVNRAYAILASPEKRERYDRMGATETLPMKI